MRTEKVQYYVYKKDQLVVFGTCSECAEFLGVSKKYIRWMCTPSYKKIVGDNAANRTICIRMEEED